MAHKFMEQICNSENVTLEVLHDTESIPFAVDENGNVEGGLVTEITDVFLTIGNDTEPIKITSLLNEKHYEEIMKLINPQESYATRNDYDKENA